MQNALFIYNPRSGGNRLIQLDSILGRFRDQGIRIQPFCLSGSDDHERLINTLTQHYFDLLVISGGDGSINFVINILLKHHITLPIGIIPAGTSNDLARNLKIPLDQKKAADLIVAGKTCAIDVGLANNTIYFLSSYAGGLFTDISYKTEGDLKKNLGPLAYYLKGVQELSQINSFRLTVETEDCTFEEEILLFFVLNGPHVAGLTDLVKEATPTDGFLHLVLIKKCDLVDLAGLFFNILGGLSLQGNDKVKLLSATEFGLKSDCKIVLSIDGEKSGNLPMKLNIETKKLIVFSGLYMSQ